MYTSNLSQIVLKNLWLLVFISVIMFTDAFSHNTGTLKWIDYTRPLLTTKYKNNAQWE